MALEQRCSQNQRLILTQTMHQSLHLLSLSSLDLCQEIQEIALSNPLLEVTLPDFSAFSLEEARNQGENGAKNLDFPKEYVKATSSKRDDEEGYDFTDFYTSEGSFTDFLLAQLGEMKKIPPATLQIARYLVENLDSRGYLDVPLEILALETGQTPQNMQEGLALLQTLEPVGVGARNLQECLHLQLKKSSFKGTQLGEMAENIISQGLPELAQGDMAVLRKKVGGTPSNLKKAVEILQSFQPIPCQGFPGTSATKFVVPEANIWVRDGRVSVEICQECQPKITVDLNYAQNLPGDLPPEVAEYIQIQQKQGEQLLANLEHRRETITKILLVIVQIQQDFFVNGLPLRPMTMQQVAEQLEMSPSTVSRTVKEKFVLFQGRPLLLKTLFSVPVKSKTPFICENMRNSQEFSPHFIQEIMKQYITTEPSTAPYSDDILREILENRGIHISRRTVAKYRNLLGFPTAGIRRRKG